RHERRHNLCCTCHTLMLPVYNLCESFSCPLNYTIKCPFWIIFRSKRRGERYMVAISIQIEGQNGLTWPYWKRLVAEIEDVGFAGLFRSDHFTNARPPDKDSLEMVVSLTYLADHTQRMHFGRLVAPISVRNPSMLARQATAL